MIKFCPIASGSSGNCTFVGSSRAKVLVDAGISGIKATSGLEKIGVSSREINAIFITHDHSDHISGAGVLSRKLGVPIYATKGTWDVIGRKLGKIESKNIRVIKDKETVEVNDLLITPFRTPHDARESVGYSVCLGAKKAVIATDLGHINSEIVSALKDSDVCLLEANHDIQMLKQGPYPYVLKQRVLGDFGHLSNETCGNLILEILSPKLKQIYLGHLSQENNTPTLAFDTVYGILKQNNAINGMFKLDMANRTEVSTICEV